MSIDEDVSVKVARHEEWIRGHEQLCASRFSDLKTTLGLLIKVIGWVGALLIMTVIATLGWSLSKQFDQRPYFVAPYAQHSEPTIERRPT